LAVFRLRGLRAGSIIQLADLRQATGRKREPANDDVRRALSELIMNGYLVETRAAVELTPKGDAYIYGEEVG
jgi:hypothetical protein